MGKRFKMTRRTRIEGQTRQTEKETYKQNPSGENTLTVPEEYKHTESFQIYPTYNSTYNGDL